MFMSSYICKVCGAEFNDPNQFAQHIKKIHNLGMKDYYDKYIRKPGEGICPVCKNPTKYKSVGQGYAQYCSSSCARRAAMEKEDHTEIECCICHAKIIGKNKVMASKEFSKHLIDVHKIYVPKIYYDNFVRKPKEGRCKVCGKETHFGGILTGYVDFCSKECALEYSKKDENNSNNKLHLFMKLKEQAKNLIEKVKTKYSDFLKNDKRTSWSDVRTDSIKQVNYNKTEKVETVDGDIVEVKTEISCTTQRDPWTGSQTRYVPKYESCNKNYDFDDIIDPENEMNETEWCR